MDKNKDAFKDVEDNIANLRLILKDVKRERQIRQVVVSVFIQLAILAAFYMYISG